MVVTQIPERQQEIGELLEYIRKETVRPPQMTAQGEP
jgi:hypothetical protein